MGQGEQAGGIEAEVQDLGRSLLSRMNALEGRSRFSREIFYDRMIALSMANPDFKARLFRLVDVLPALDESRAVVSHLREYLADSSANIPVFLRVPVSAASRLPAITAPIVRRNVTSMARRFMISDDRGEITATLRERRRLGLSYTVDLLGEAVLSEREVDSYIHRVREILELLATESRSNHSSRAGTTREESGPASSPEVNLSLKISALDPRILSTDPEGAIRRLKVRLRPIIRQAMSLGAFINFDMEHHQLKELTLELFCSLFEEEEFRDWRHCGLVIQAYLRESEADLRRLIDWARKHDRRLTVRLVKGAYWDYETVVARQKNWPVPVYSQKPETDLNFERLSLLLLKNRENVYPAIASHNVRSIAVALIHAEKMGVATHELEFQMLYGMADSLKKSLVEKGFAVREYCSVGDLIPGMAYLVRRLLENSSNEGFLASRFSGRAAPEELLRNPADAVVRKQAEAPGSPKFQNAPTLDFTMKTEREKIQQALANVGQRCGRHYPMIIGGEEVTASQTLTSPNPSNPAMSIGTVPRAGKAEADRAVAAAKAAAASWRTTPADRRAALVKKVADLLEKRRCEFAALEILECGKPWIEADADVCEAIDFCRFYAATMRDMATPEVTQPLPGEENLQVWRPRGVAVVIAPWNFPLAILCGMTTAALVTGNTVIMKPAEQSPVVAVWFMEVLIQAGIPPGVVNLVTGLGEEAGAPLVEHPDVAVIAFTGSREVGLRIWEAAGRTHPGQTHLKKAICEMGGKNALIIDSDADLDDAVEGALYSAFGYQGQKCSALSRVIVLKELYDRFLERFVEAAKAVTVGDPADPGTFMGPLIDEAAREKARRCIEQGKKEARLVFEGTISGNTDGYFVTPVIFADVASECHLFREEIFGPVVAVTKADSFDHAIALANDSIYGLTGGIYSRSPAHIERAKRELEVGNLYVNRHITGSIVERQPFGGYKLSGGGTKAGGREYLQQFMVPQVLTENTMRHGFAPDAESGGA